MEFLGTPSFIVVPSFWITFALKITLVEVNFNLNIGISWVPQPSFWCLPFKWHLLYKSFHQRQLQTWSLEFHGCSVFCSSVITSKDICSNNQIGGSQYLFECQPYLHYTRLKKPARNKHSSLFGPFGSQEEKKSFCEYFLFF